MNIRFFLFCIRAVTPVDFRDETQAGGTRKMHTGIQIRVFFLMQFYLNIWRGKFQTKFELFSSYDCGSTEPALATYSP
jgi:hypothetical protein